MAVQPLGTGYLLGFLDLPEQQKLMTDQKRNSGRLDLGSCYSSGQ